MSDRTAAEAMAEQDLLRFSDISKISDLKKVCEALISDAHTQIQRLAYRVDAEANELRITYKAQMDIANNLLVRVKK